MAATKFCRDCGEYRPVAEFTRNSRQSDGLAFYCKTHARSRRNASKRLQFGPPKHRFAQGVVPNGHKWCPDCGQVKPLDEFPKSRATPSGTYSYCKPCHNIRGKASKDKVGGSRTYHLKRRYGITAEDADAMLEAQGGLCAICEALPAEHVDHDHATGVVRQLLCFNCNGGLGQFKDDPGVLRAAADYVERHRERQAARTDRPADTRPGRSSAHQRRVRARLLAMREYDAGRVRHPPPPGLLLDD
jgi:hypothetical protein